MFNEFMICFITPFFITFTEEEVETAETRVIYGWIVVGAVFMVIGVNWYFVIKFGVRNVGIMVKRVMNRDLIRKEKSS
jgi:hypothetical protein